MPTLRIKNQLSPQQDELSLSIQGHFYLCLSFVMLTVTVFAVSDFTMMFVAFCA